MREAIVEPVVALDDDPTGAQTLTGIHVLLDWSPRRVAAALDGRRAVHLLTNVRALRPAAVAPVVRSGAAAAVEGAPAAHVLLRGDSTLRGHVGEELAGLRAVVDPGGAAPVLLVPALPAAGRVTIDGIHLIERDGLRTPLHETEYATDGVFAYRSARLLAWAEERTAGALPAAEGRELHLDELRAGGAEGVAAEIESLCRAGRPAAFAPDAENDADLETIAQGYAIACAAGARALVRCAPAFVGVLSGTAADRLVPAPTGRDVLVVCGSYVPTSTRQLARLTALHPRALVELDALALASDDAAREIRRAASATQALLDTGHLAIVATPRERPPGTETLEAGDRIARGLAAIVAALEPTPAVMIAKGGITSQVTLHEGLGADEAEVVGPVLPGVSHWRAAARRGPVDYLVVPGNVGDDDLLSTLVDLVLAGSSPC
jgi:uncharacterized protein YgbK (DUF1537 family)